jgi:hypothetical protein
VKTRVNALEARSGLLSAIRTKSDADHRRRGTASISLTPRYRLERGIIMIWTSDSAGVLMYTIAGMFLVLSSMWVPA